MNVGDPRQKKRTESDLYQKAYESGYNFVNGMGFWSVDPKETQRRRIMTTSGHLASCSWRGAISVCQFRKMRRCSISWPSCFRMCSVL